MQIIANISTILAPLIPFSAEKVFKWLSVTADWEFKTVAAGYFIPEIEILFERLDKSVIDEEKKKLQEIVDPLKYFE